jgi:hypothetical protein
MALAYKQRNGHDDGQPRTSIPVWVHLTKDEFDAVCKWARIAKYGSRWRRFLHKIVEEALLEMIKQS